MNWCDPISWRFQTGLATRLHPEKDGDLEPTEVWRSAGGVGLAYDLGDFTRVYGLAEAHLDVGARLDHSVSLGPGGTLGILLGSDESRLRAHLAGSGSYFALGERSAWWRITGGIRRRARRVEPAYVSCRGVGEEPSSLEQ